MEILQSVSSNYDVVVLEGIHLSGKTTTIKKFDQHPPFYRAMYSSWESYGGRKTLLSPDGSGTLLPIYDQIPVSSSFVFLADFIAQTKEGSKPVLFDRGYLSCAYYGPSEFHENIFEMAIAVCSMLWVLVDPVFSDEHKTIYESYQLNQGKNDNRVAGKTYWNYIRQANDYKNLANKYIPQSDLIVYENNFLL